MISASDMATAFPAINPGVKPLGARVLVQLRVVREKTNHGILLVQDTRDFNKSIAQIAKVVALGPLAYKNRDSMVEWPEGTWCRPGELVRVPRYGGDRMERVLPGTEDTVIFCIFNDHEIIAKIDEESISEIDDIR